MSTLQVTGRVTASSDRAPLFGLSVELRSWVMGGTIVPDVGLPEIEEPLTVSPGPLNGGRTAPMIAMAAPSIRRARRRAPGGGGPTVETYVAEGPSVVHESNAQGEFQASFDVTAAENEVRTALDLAPNAQLRYAVSAQVRMPPAGQVVTGGHSQYRFLTAFPYHFELIVPIVPERLPEVWACSVPIRLLWKAAASGNDLNMVEASLRGLNNRLYDCTDGQWRVGRFLIHDDRSELNPKGQGVGHVHRTSTHGPHGHAEGRPDDPEHWEVNEGSSVGAYLMEFLHSWTGLKDEYETREDGPRTNCPSTDALRQSTNACVMDDTVGTPTELCRPGTHNPNTEQGNVRDMDCYSWLRKVMHEAGHTEFQVPSAHIPGPTQAPTLHFVYLTIRRVRQIDDPDPSVFQGPGDFYARVRMANKWFARSKHQDDRADVSPNWLFGLGLSSGGDVTVPIRIEILDHDSLSGDDLCDIGPRAGKKVLDFTYNTATGVIAGDVAGMRDAPITVRGAGDSDRVEVTFVVTSR